MFDIFRNAYLFVLIVLGVYSIFTLRKAAYYIKIYAIVTLLVEIIGIIYLKTYQKPISWLYNIYAVFEIWAWANFFMVTIQKKASAKILILFGIYILLFAYLGHFKIMKLNNEGILLNNIIVAAFIVYYFYYILINNLNITGIFWIFIGALFYHIGGFLLTGLVQIIAKTDNALASKLFEINAILNIFFYAFLLFGILQLDRKQNLPSA